MVKSGHVPAVKTGCAGVKTALTRREKTSRLRRDERGEEAAEAADTYIFPLGGGRAGVGISFNPRADLHSFVICETAYSGISIS